MASHIEIIGPSGCGKSTLLKNICVNNAEEFTLWNQPPLKMPRMSIILFVIKTIVFTFIFNSNLSIASRKRNDSSLYGIKIEAKKLLKKDFWLHLFFISTIVKNIRSVRKAREVRTIILDEGLIQNLPLDALKELDDVLLTEVLPTKVIFIQLSLGNYLKRSQKRVEERGYLNFKHKIISRSILENYFEESMFSFKEKIEFLRVNGVEVITINSSIEISLLSNYIIKN